MKPKDQLVVYSVKSSADSTIWIRAGHGFVNVDGSINVTLDVLPIDGKLHIRRKAKGD